jgi:hypothetical protein
MVAYKRIKTEHAGAKNGGGAWMTRAEAKETSKRKRRQHDKQALDPWIDPDPQAAVDDGSDLEEFSARASRGVLRHMTEDEGRAGLSWDVLRP